MNSGKIPQNRQLPHIYKTDLDVTDVYDYKNVSRFQKLIEILRWAVELGRIGVQREAVLLSQYQSSPQEGHLEALYLIFHFLSNNTNKILSMDPSVPDDEESIFNINTDWE